MPEANELATNDEHALVLHDALAGTMVVGVGLDTGGSLVIEFTSHVLRLLDGQKFELMTRDCIANIERPETVVN